MQDAGAPSRGCKEKEGYKRSEIGVLVHLNVLFVVDVVGWSCIVHCCELWRVR